MTDLALTEVRHWRGRDVVAADGETVGTVEDVWHDEATGQLEWALVKLGVLTERFVPLADARIEHGSLQVPYSAEMIREAPSVAADEWIAPVDEQELYAHYGAMPPAAPALPAAEPSVDAPARRLRRLPG